MSTSMRYVATMPTTLAELEAMCAAARANGLPDDAAVIPPNLLSSALSVVAPLPEPAEIPNR